MAKLSLTGFNANNKQITGVADGSANTDAVNKQQLDAAIRGLDWKQEVVAASAGANVTLATPGTTLDGVTLVANDRVLLKDQTLPAQNGIYVWTASGTPLTRALDADTGIELSGSTVTVQKGTTNQDRVYRVTSDDPLVVDTTAVTLVQVGAGSTPYTASTGLTLVGNDVRVVAGNGIIADGTSTRVDPAVVARKFSADCVVTTNPQTFTHNLGTKDITAQVRINSTDELVEADITATSTTTATVNFGAAPAAAQYRVTFVG